MDFCTSAGPYLHMQLLPGVDGFAGCLAGSMYIHKATAHGQNSSQVRSAMCLACTACIHSHALRVIGSRTLCEDLQALSSCSISLATRSVVHILRLETQSCQASAVLQTERVNHTPYAPMCCDNPCVCILMALSIPRWTAKPVTSRLPLCTC